MKNSLDFLPFLSFFFSLSHLNLSWPYTHFHLGPFVLICLTLLFPSAAAAFFNMGYLLFSLFSPNPYVSLFEISEHSQWRWKPRLGRSGAINKVSIALCKGRGGMSITQDNSKNATRSACTCYILTYAYFMLSCNIYQWNTRNNNTTLPWVVSLKTLHLP